MASGPAVPAPVRAARQLSTTRHRSPLRPSNSLDDPIRVTTNFAAGIRRFRFVLMRNSITAAAIARPFWMSMGIGRLGVWRLTFQHAGVGFGPGHKSEDPVGDPHQCIGRRPKFRSAQEKGAALDESAQQGNLREGRLHVLFQR